LRILKLEIWGFTSAAYFSRPFTSGLTISPFSPVYSSIYILPSMCKMTGELYVEVSYVLLDAHNPTRS
jgi:hypothetical protein